MLADWLHKLTCPSESPQHPALPFPITAIIADHRSHAFLLELPRPLCSLVTHPGTCTYHDKANGSLYQVKSRFTPRGT